MRFSSGDTIMKNGSFFIPREKIAFGGGLRNFEGLYMTWETDPDVARRILPPPLELPEPAHPIVTAYVVNIRDPGMAPWYMEAAISLLCRHGAVEGQYFLNLQLSGPGGPMGLYTGRETGLPKKLCERIMVERNDDYARAFVEAKGRRIFDVEMEIGNSNSGPAAWGIPSEKGPQPKVNCFVFATGGPSLLAYSVESEVHSVEEASIQSIIMEPSLDDPWAELKVVKPGAAAYVLRSEGAATVSELARLKGEQADNLASYLLTGRYDRSFICKGHQRYGQF
jgi:acetoacetate decarboxylase